MIKFAHREREREILRKTVKNFQIHCKSQFINKTRKPKIFSLKKGSFFWRGDLLTVISNNMFVHDMVRNNKTLFVPQATTPQSFKVN